MDRPQELQLHIRESADPNSGTNAVAPATKEAPVMNQPQQTRRGSYIWWFLVSLYTILLLVGQSAATLLGRFYFDNGGNSKWLATFVQSAGFPILIPFLIYFSQHSSTPTPLTDTKRNYSFFAKLSVMYIAFGLAVSGDNLMYSYGLLYLPVSTYSLICASQLAFNALFSYFFNSLKLTLFVLNSIVLLTISATVLGIHSDSSGSSNIPQGKYIIGFMCTIGASALYSLVLSFTQVFFEKIRKRETFSVVLEMQIYTVMTATCVCIIGLFVSGEWRELSGEMELFKTGKVSYMMTLVWTAILWQVFGFSCLGLIFEASSLFSNVISTVCLPVVPILAVILFHDKMDGMKVVAMFLAIWGFVSYVYEHYLDYSKLQVARRNANSRSASSCT